MTAEETIWKGNLNDDCTAEWKGMTLRAEEMDKAYWWWAVYGESGDIIDDSDSYYPEKFKKGKVAREAAENAAKKHMQKKATYNHTQCAAVRLGRGKHRRAPSVKR